MSNLIKQDGDFRIEQNSNLGCEDIHFLKYKNFCIGGMDYATYKSTKTYIVDIASVNPTEESDIEQVYEGTSYNEAIEALWSNREQALSNYKQAKWWLNYNA